MLSKEYLNNILKKQKNFQENKEEGESKHMVKITNITEPTSQTENKDEHENELENLKLTGKDKQKTSAVTMRLTESMMYTIKTQATLKNTTMTKIIEDILLEYYGNTKITRDYYEPSKDVHLLIPIKPELIEKYIEEEINLLADYVEDETGTIKINQFDRQSFIVNEDPQSYITYTLKSINNYLDSYNKLGFYCYDDTSVQDVSKNHLGLIAINMNTYPQNHKEKALNMNTLLLLVHEYNNEVQSVKIITPEYAIELANAVENNTIVDYIENVDDNITLEKIRKWNEDNRKVEEDLLKENEELKQMLHDLKEDSEQAMYNYELKKREEYLNKLDKIMLDFETLRLTTAMKLKFIEEAVDELEKSNQDNKK